MGLIAPFFPDWHADRFTRSFQRPGMVLMHQTRNDKATCCFKRQQLRHNNVNILVKFQCCCWCFNAVGHLYPKHATTGVNFFFFSSFVLLTFRSNTHTWFHFRLLLLRWDRCALKSTFRFCSLNVNTFFLSCRRWWGRFRQCHACRRCCDGMEILARLLFFFSSLTKRESTVKTQFMHSYSVKIGWEKNCPPLIVDVTQFHGEIWEKKKVDAKEKISLSLFAQSAHFHWTFTSSFAYFFCASTHSLIRSTHTTHIKALLTALAKSLLFFSAQKKCVKSLAIICIMLFLLLFLNSEKRKCETRVDEGSVAIIAQLLHWEKTRLSLLALRWELSQQVTHNTRHTQRSFLYLGSWSQLFFLFWVLSLLRVHTLFHTFFLSLSILSAVEG